VTGFRKLLAGARIGFSTGAARIGQRPALYPNPVKNMFEHTAIITQQLALAASGPQHNVAALAARRLETVALALVGWNRCRRIFDPSTVYTRSVAITQEGARQKDSLRLPAMTTTTLSNAARICRAPADERLPVSVG